MNSKSNRQNIHERRRKRKIRTNLGVGVEQLSLQLDDLGGTKLIAYPWTSQDVTLVMTS